MESATCSRNHDAVGPRPRVRSGSRDLRARLPTWRLRPGELTTKRGRSASGYVAPFENFCERGRHFGAASWWLRGRRLEVQYCRIYPIFANARSSAASTLRSRHSRHSASLRPGPRRRPGLRNSSPLGLGEGPRTRGTIPTSLWHPSPPIEEGSRACPAGLRLPMQRYPAGAGDL